MTIKRANMMTKTHKITATSSKTTTMTPNNHKETESNHRHVKWPIYCTHVWVTSSSYLLVGTVSLSLQLPLFNHSFSTPLLFFQYPKPGFLPVFLLPFLSLGPVPFSHAARDYRGRVLCQVGRTLAGWRGEDWIKSSEEVKEGWGRRDKDGGKRWKRERNEMQRAVENEREVEEGLASTIWWIIC